MCRLAPRLAAECVAILVAATAPLAAAEPGSLVSGPWKLETVRLLDGRRLEGLVLDAPAADGAGTEAGQTAPASRHDAAAPILFVQVVQPPGKPAELIAWPPIGAARVAAVERLPPADRAALAARVERLRHRRGRQHEAETAVPLSRTDEDGPWRYAGRWFAVESTADPRLTREIVVRLESVCAAFETLVPPPGPPDDPRPFLLRLCGTAAEYRGLQEAHGVVGEHPAFYVVGSGLLAAGSDLPALIAQERAADDALSLAERDVVARDRGFEADVRRLASDLDQQGLPAAKRAEAVQLARTRWQRERETMLAQIGAARRDNAARVAAARREFFARLTHEAWHAHADRRLARGGRLPPWLDEGLAQVFETAALEAGELRLDAPDPARLKALHELLSGADPPRLADTLEAGPAQFLLGHRGGQESSRRKYLLAWGLAFHLAVLEPVLSPRTLAGICAADAVPAPRVAGDADRTAADGAASLRRFEGLVGMPLAEFEAAWRRRMLALASGAAAGEPPR